MTMILGISALYHDSAAAIVRDGEIIAAAQEERFSRRKNDPRFPVEAVKFCISKTDGIGKIDAVAYYEDPVLLFDRVVKNAIEFSPQTENIWPESAASQLQDKLDVLVRLKHFFDMDALDNVFVVDHHLSHAASAFYPSPFRDAAVLVIDGVGEWATTTIADGTDTELTALSQIQYPHSLGLLYSAMTYHCGFKVNSGEFKLMGLAPFGEPRFVNTILENILDLKGDGSFFLNSEYFAFQSSHVSTNAKFADLFGICPRHSESPISRDYMDLAASVQTILDEAILRIARTALKLTGRTQLCMAGGVALNCVANGSLSRKLPELKGIWIQPAAGDAGGALGAALYTAHRRYGALRHVRVGYGDAQRGSLLGPSYSNAEIELELMQEGLIFHVVSDETDYVNRVATELASGMVVGRFAGNMEFGPRALGNRSILADARRIDGQTYVNNRVKFRESWRPFAPAVLAERAGEYFNMTQESPYMLLVTHVREDLRLSMDITRFRNGDADMLKLINQPRSMLPAVTHVDYSARVQTVDKERNPDFYNLLRRFDEMTGCPVLINTSLNVRGEPIACSPTDAIQCFVKAGIDVMAIGRCLIFKREQPDHIRSREGDGRNASD
jgi:carbamoyltransferase